VQQSEGHLEIESKLGEGTTVTILLPRYVPVPATASA
jgi:signal transduction histidine kinase